MFSPRSGSSHYTFRKPGCQPITIPKHEPIKKVYVKSILQKSVSRPSSYHQSLQLVITSGDVQRTQTAELWVTGELRCV